MGEGSIPIVISGTINEVKDALMKAYATTQYRKYMGWRLFNDDEFWTYETKDDERVCQYCRMYESMREFIGSEVPILFSYWSRLEKNSIYPDVHSMPEYTFLRGDCRCRMVWYDYIYTLTERLFKEIQENIMR